MPAKSLERGPAARPRRPDPTDAAPGRPSRPRLDALAIGWLLLVFAFAIRVPTDTDTWWHLRSADQILKSHAIPRVDSFSFTRLGQPWIDHGWAMQLVMAGFQRLFSSLVPGPSGVSVGLAVYMAVFATLGMALSFVTAEGRAWIRVAVLSVAAATAAVFWSPRPQMISFVLSAALLLLLDRYRRGRIRHLWLVVPLMALWANLHGGFFIGFVFLAGFGAGAVLERLLAPDDPETPPWSTVRHVALVGVAGAVALAFNPYGTAMWRYALNTFQMSATQFLIQEWASPDFHERAVIPFALLILIVMAGLGRAGRRLPWTELTLLCGTAFMSLYSLRNIPFFALVAGPIAVRYWTHALDRGVREPPRARGSGARGRLAAAATLAGALAFTIFRIATVLSARHVDQVQRAALPVGAAEYLARTPMPGHMFNTYNYGGYLMYAVPGIPVFVDGRADLYGDDHLTEWVKAASAMDWKPVFERWGIGFAVVERYSSIAKVLRGEPGWEEVYADEMASIFRRRTASPAGQIAAPSPGAAPAAAPPPGRRP